MKERTPCEMVHLKVDSQMTREDSTWERKKNVLIRLQTSR